VIFSDSQDTTQAFDRTTHQRLWSFEGEQKMGGGSLSQPLVEGDFVYLALPSGQVVALELKTGKKVWSTEVFSYDVIRSLEFIEKGYILALSTNGKTALLNLDGKVLAYRDNHSEAVGADFLRSPRENELCASFSNYQLRCFKIFKSNFLKGL
jgi:outer membrane protein assembly factor BamB